MLWQATAQVLQELLSEESPPGQEGEGFGRMFLSDATI